MKYFARKKGIIFEPITNDDYRKSLKIKDDTAVVVETWKDRNVLFFRKYFALLNCAINHFLEDEKFEQYKDIDFFRKYLLIMIGKCDLKIGLKGEKNYFPHSISFKSMDDVEFEFVYSRSLDMILKYFISHISKEDFENDILNFI